MNNKGNPYPKKGNNTLFLVLGVLLVIFLGLIYIGSMRESSINQLISSAAPDSSAFANDSLLTPPLVAEDEEFVEEVKAEVPQVKDTANVSSTPSTTSQGDSTLEGTAATEPVPIKVVESNEGTIYTYKVKKGDTMYKIAAKFGNKPADVVLLNGLPDMAVQIDKQIKVKIKGLHTVASGEGLNAVSEKYGAPSKSILVANGLTSESLQVGILLIIPLK